MSIANLTWSEWNRWRDVGQAGSLRGGWLPPLSDADTRGTLWVGPIGNRPQVDNLPYNSDLVSRFEHTDGPPASYP
jgi:hypothetical protein